MTTPTFRIITLSGGVIAPLLNGGTIAAGILADATIECVISGVNVTIFTTPEINGGKPITQQSVPRVISGKPPIHAMNLPAGSYVTTIEADGVMLAPLKFTVASVPVASVVGTNLNGVNNPAWSPAQIQTYCTNHNQIGWKIDRAWIEVPALLELGPAKYCDQILQIKAGTGCELFFQIQYQQTATSRALQMMSGTDQAAILALLEYAKPAYASVCNERDGGYFDGTDEQLAAFTQFLQPYRAYGKLGAPSFVRSDSALQQYAAAGYAAGTDFLDRHAYSSESIVISTLQKNLAWCTTHGYKLFSSEFGVNGISPNSVWAAQEAAVITWARSQPITLLQYAAYPLAGSGYPYWLTSQLMPSQPFFAEYQEAMK